MHILGVWHVRDTGVWEYGISLQTNALLFHYGKQTKILLEEQFIKMCFALHIGQKTRNLGQIWPFDPDQ